MYQVHQLKLIDLYYRVIFPRVKSLGFTFPRILFKVLLRVDDQDHWEYAATAESENIPLASMVSTFAKK